MVSFILASSIALLAFGIYKLSQIGRRDSRMPPGPPTIPILGNLHQLSTAGIHIILKEFTDKYGGVFSLKFGPANVIVISDREAVYELMDRRALLYSDRPHTYLGDLIVSPSSFQAIANNSLLREKRKAIAQDLSPQKLDEKHVHLMEAEASILLNDLLVNPDDMFNHVRRYTASVAAAMVYGQRAPTFDSFFGKIFYQTIGQLVESMAPGASPPFDEFPFLKYLPTRWNFWKRRALLVKKNLEKWEAEINSLLEQRRSQGQIRDCLYDNLLERYSKEGWPMSRVQFSNLMRETGEAAADTTAGQILTLIMAFATNPDVVKKAQAEIDKVCGPNRAPRWSDFKSLPYINCIVKEGMRWRPVAPSGLPHRVRQDDIYKGMLLPKDAMVLIASWALNHDEKHVESPHNFHPERFAKFPEPANQYLHSPAGDRDHYSYGSGRRSCVGIHMAERTQWRIAAKILWAYDILEPLDPTTGKVAPLDTMNYKTGMVLEARPFRVRMIPRSAEHAATIAHMVQEAADFLAPWE